MSDALTALVAVVSVLAYLTVGAVVAGIARRDDMPKWVQVRMNDVNEVANVCAAVMVAIGWPIIVAAVVFAAAVVWPLYRLAQHVSDWQPRRERTRRRIAELERELGQR